MSRLSMSACNSSKVSTQSTYGLTVSRWISAFLAVQGPTKMILHPGSDSLTYLAIIAMGERLLEM